MLFMKSIKLSRLQLLFKRRINRLLKINTEFKRNSSFTIQNTPTQIIGVRSIHCCSVRNEFYKFIHKPRDEETQKGSLSHSRIKTLLQNCESVSHQLDAFYSYAGLSIEDIGLRECAHAEIETVLRDYFPSCSLRLIGSTVSGLGLRGCDMDVSFHTNDNDEVGQDCSVGNERVYLTKEIEEGKVSVSAFPSLNTKQKLHMLRRLLRESEVVGTIIPGRFPILSFNYKGLGVDLGLNNISGLQGTSFMRLCTELDPRVAPLFRFVSYWAKHNRLCGGAMKFKSYALFLLVLYFLQTRTPPILPTVEHMMDRTDLQKNSLNWSYDICKYTHLIEKSKNIQSLEELLQEFFFFYAFFDFSYVICTKKCELVKASEFGALENTDFELNSISIQDPFNLSLNVTLRVNWKYCRHLTKALLYSCEAYQDRSRWVPSREVPWGLLSLFDSQPSFDAISRNRVTLQIPVERAEAGLGERVVTIFRHCLDFECKTVDENELQLLKLNRSTNGQTHSEENGVGSQHGTLLTRFLCTTSDTWFGRSNFHTNSDSQIATTDSCNSDVGMTDTSNFDSQVADSGNSELPVGSRSNFLDVEREISKKLSTSREGNKKEEFSFLCECRFDGQNLHVIMDPVSGDVFIPKLAIFLKDYIPRCINKIV